MSKKVGKEVRGEGGPFRYLARYRNGPPGCSYGIPVRSLIINRAAVVRIPGAVRAQRRARTHVPHVPRTGDNCTKLRRDPGCKGSGPGLQMRCGPIRTGNGSATGRGGLAKPGALARTLLRR